MNYIQHTNHKIFAATTLKDPTTPEQNNTALHVCIHPEDVMKNRKELAKQLNLPLENWTLPWQKHTDKFQEVTQDDLGKGAFDKNTSIMDVDAIYTTQANQLIGVFTADCVGILLVDESSPCICAIHSGWKGTTQMITYKTVQHLIQEKKINPEQTHAYFSPSILKNSLEVGMEVIEQIKNIDKTLHLNTEPFIQYMPNQKAYLDNQGINMELLKLCGIQHIHPSTLDTKTETKTCFSYRNDKKTGEHFTFGYIKKDA